MKRPYFDRKHPDPIWHPASYVSKWFVDQTPTPHIDSDDAYKVIFHKYLVPLQGETDLIQEVVPTIHSLLYGSILLHILAGKQQQDFENAYQQFQARVPRLLQEFSTQEHSKIEFALLLFGGEMLGKLQQVAAASRPAMLAYVVHLMWRYKPEQLVTWARAMLQALLVLVKGANVPDEVLKRILVPMAVVAIEEELP